MAKDPAARYATCGDLSAAAYAAFAMPDQDRATDILQRSQVAQLPAAFAGQPPSGIAPAPPAMANHAPPQGPVWPATSGSSGAPGPQSTGWAGPPAWGTGDAGSPGVPPWGQPSPRRRNPWPWVAAAAALVVAVAGGLAVVVAHPWRSSPPAAPTAPTSQAPPDAVERFGSSMTACMSAAPRHRQRSTFSTNPSVRRAAASSGRMRATSTLR